MTSSLANQPHRFPVSVKGVLFADGGYLLLKNERDEWELPGGKLQPGEDLAGCLEREILEELNVTAQAKDILDSWIYHVMGVDVLIVTFACVAADFSAVRLSSEHNELGVFAFEEVEKLNMPAGYKQSIVRFRENLPTGGESG